MIKLTIFLCSLYMGTCLSPHTFEDRYSDNFSCMLDGYQRSYDKMVKFLKGLKAALDIQC